MSRYYFHVKRGQVTVLTKKAWSSPIPPVLKERPRDARKRSLTGRL